MDTGCSAMAGHVNVGLTVSCWAAISAAVLVTAAPAANAQQGGPAGAAIEEVIVTARKREESVQDVPVSIDVLGGDALIEQGTLNLRELQFAVPGFYVQSFESRSTITMRGVGAQIAGGTSAVATHLNGIYQASAAAQLNRLFDIERVEVVKGPQGTLYGRNSTGGVLNILTRMPGNEFAGNVSVGYGTFDTVRVDGGITAPLGDSWGLRFAASYSDGEGQFTNVVTGEKIGDENFLGGRLTLAGDAGPVSVEAFAQVTRDKTTFPLTLIPLDNATFEPLLDWDQTAFDDPLEPLLTRDVTTLGLTLSGDINDKFSWRSITGYLDYDEPESLVDANPRPDLPFQQSIDFPQSARQFSQEFQLLYTGDRTNWVLGAYYLDDKQERTRVINFVPVFPVPVINSASRDDVEVISLFFDLNYSITDRLTLNAGIRYNDEEVRNRFAGSGPFDGDPFDISGNQGDPTGRFGLDFAIRDGVMVYGSVSSGYQAGFFQTQFDPNSNTNGPSEVKPEEITAFEVGLKTVLPNNLGFFNVAIFDYDYTDMQVEVGGFPLDANGNPDLTQPPVFFTANAGKASITGVDVQLSELRFTENLKFDLNAAYLDAQYDDFQTIDDTGAPVNYAGNTLPRAPEFEASIAATVDNLTFGAAAEGSFSLQYSYRDKTFFTEDNVDIASQDSFGLLNFYARVDFDGGKWGIAAAGRNLTDEKFFDFRNKLNFANTGEFRTWQLTLNYNF